MHKILVVKPISSWGRGDRSRWLGSGGGGWSWEGRGWGVGVGGIGVGRVRVGELGSGGCSWFEIILKVLLLIYKFLVCLDYIRFLTCTLLIIAYTTGSNALTNKKHEE